MNTCKMCKRPLDIPNDPTSQDCGGDCLRCMADVARDPDCIEAMGEIWMADIALLDEAVGFAPMDLRDKARMALNRIGVNEYVDPEAAG